MPKTININGQKFGKLTVIKHSHTKNKHSYYWCQCECGTTIQIRTDSFKSGKTISCGCVYSKTRRQYHNPTLVSAKAIWRFYADNDISFTDFLQLSQESCYYCGSSPSNSYNRYLTKKKKIKHGIVPEWANQANFIYNGLDRIDPLQRHTLNNIVPCCFVCNKAKLDMPLKTFREWIIQVHNHSILNTQIKIIQSNPLGQIKAPILSSAKTVWRKEYADGCSFETFLKLSQNECYYCGRLPSNSLNRYLTKQGRKDKRVSFDWAQNATFIYNGLDRLNSTRNHAEDNIVPCCKICNVAKNIMNIEEFKGWIIKVFNHLNSNQ